jgi:hypothetical protein
MASRNNRRDGNEDLQELLEQLESGLKIDKHNLDEALETQPDIFYRVSSKYTQLVSLRDQLKQQLQEAEADADLDIRRKARDKDDKITENEIKARIRVDKEVARLAGELLTVGNQAAQYMALKEAFMQRSYVLKDLVSLHVSGYYGSNVDGAKASMRDGKAEHVRTEQKKMRDRR